jgi:hypothetical protein
MAHALPPRAGRHPARGLITAAVVAVAGLALALAQTSAGHALLRKAGLYEEPASYTSLAFTDPQSLPSRLSPVPTRVSVSFGISNSSADPRSYRWSVVLQRAGRVKRLAAGEVAVPAGESATVAPIVTASCSAGQARMSVQVAVPAESIAFWLACSPRGESAGQAGGSVRDAAAASFEACVPGTEGSGE